MLAVSRFIVHVEPLRSSLADVLSQVDEMLAKRQNAVSEEADALRESLMFLMLDINRTLVDIFHETVKDLTEQGVWVYSPEIADTDADEHIQDAEWHEVND